MSRVESTRRNERRAMLKSKYKHLVQTRNRSMSAGMLLLSMLLGGLAVSGCAGGTSTSAPSTASGTAYTYQGVTNVTQVTSAQTYIPFWTFVLEGAENSFSYDNAVYINNLPLITSGTYSADSGYLALTSQSSVGNSPAFQLANAGYALTIPGEAALLRPGDFTQPPVVTAGMNSCPVISSGEKFLFVALPGFFWKAANAVAYGSVQASTDSTGTTWSFSNQSQSPLAGSGTPSAYPASFTGTCGQGVTGYSIGVLPTVTWGSYEPQISVSPNGFFTETTTGQEIGVNGGYAQPPLVGVVAPSSALNTTSIVSGKYLGFLYEPLSVSASTQTATQLVSFGAAAAGSGSGMTGGVFPNDDPSQTPAANITVNFGSQSATQNGLFTGVTVTIPDTSAAGNCGKNGGTSGAGSNGSSTCSFTAVAIVGNPKNNFVIFLIGQDPTQGDAPFGLYLYQQQQ